MPIQPTPGDVHVDRALTDLSVAYSQSRSNFVADQVFPKIPVQHRSDSYFKYEREQFFRTDVQLRAPGAETAGTGFGITTDSYLCKVYGIHKDVDDQTRANADSPINIDRDATELVTQQVLQFKEQQFVTSFFDTGKWAFNPTTTTKWGDAASTPIEDLRDAIVTQTKATSYKPNVLVIGPEVWQALVDHVDLLERVKFTQGPAMASEGLVAQLLGLDKVLTAWGVKNTQAEKDGTFDATTDMDFHFGKGALLLHVNPSPGLNTVTAGATFTWQGLYGTGADGVRIKRYRMEPIASDRIEAELAFSQKIIATDLGTYFDAVVD
ncbi:MAG: major capsid protein [Acidimicrobiia bacterium]|nr:major capsid protein [Acidimicrobiia bacterium]